jgi:branched-chain amino acid transport system permease protein
MSSLPATAVELLILGLFLGTTYGLIALGLSLVFGVQYVINIAHGEFVMLGAYVTFFGWSIFNLHPIISGLIAIPLLFGLGVLIQDQLLERIKEKPELTSLILTFGVSIALANTAQAVFTGDYRSIDFMTSPVQFGGATFAANRAVTFVATGLALAAILGFIKYSDWGKALRATSQSPEIAKACGINTRHVRLLAFGIGAATAGFAGSFIGMMYTIFPAMGFNYLIKAFVIVVLGGLGSIVGAVVGGVIFGIVEVFGSYYLDGPTATALAFVFLIVLLLVYPQGLFGKEDPSVGGR